MAMQKVSAFNKTERGKSAQSVTSPKRFKMYYLRSSQIELAQLLDLDDPYSDLANEGAKKNIQTETFYERVFSDGYAGVPRNKGNYFPTKTGIEEAFSFAEPTSMVSALINYDESYLNSALSNGSRTPVGKFFQYEYSIKAPGQGIKTIYE